jgi:large subunit ribosomal protein L40
MASLGLSRLFAGLRVSPILRVTPCSSSSLYRPAAAVVAVCVPAVRQFTSTPCSAAKAPKGASKKGGKSGKKRKKMKGPGPDPRIRNLKMSMPRKVPAPLRFARNRHLRHWTIHRAWLLWQRKEREREERELMRFVFTSFCGHMPTLPPLFGSKTRLRNS